MTAALLSPDPSRRVMIPAVSTSFYLRSPHGDSMSIREKMVFFTFKTPCILYWLGAMAFLMGSILFYPWFNGDDDALVGLGDSYGSGCFFLGSVLFLVGSTIEVYHARYSHLNDTVGVERFAPLASSSLNVIGSIQFVVGSVYFIPIYYTNSPSTGCWLFISGCLCFCLALIVELARYSSTELKASFHWGELLSLWFIATVFNFAGNLLFISGCYFYLPRFLLLVAPMHAHANLIFATNQFVLGSIFFGLAPIVQVIGINQDLAAPTPSFLELK